MTEISANGMVTEEPTEEYVKRLILHTYIGERITETLLLNEAYWRLLEQMNELAKELHCASVTARVCTHLVLAPP